MDANEKAELIKLRFVTKTQHEIINAQRSLLEQREMELDSVEWRKRHFLNEAIKNLEVIHKASEKFSKKESA